MDELEQKIIGLQNQIDNLKSQVSSGQFSNTILQNKNLIQANGAMTSPNFVSGSAGWSLNSQGNLEANNGTFRGTLYASAGEIGGFNIGASTLTAGTGLSLDSDGDGTITGGTIQTASSGARMVLDGTNYLRAYDASNNLQIKLDTTNLRFYESGSEMGGIYNSSSGILQIYTIGGNTLWIQAPTLVNDDFSAATIESGNGASGSFTTVDLKTVTVYKGIITDIS